MCILRQWSIPDSGHDWREGSIAITIKGNGPDPHTFFHLTMEHRELGKRLARGEMGRSGEMDRIVNPYRHTSVPSNNGASRT